MALATAPLPRPPQPIKESQMLLSAFPCTEGTTAPASAAPPALVRPARERPGATWHWIAELMSEGDFS